MKKMLTILVALSFLFSGTAFAAYPASDNVDILGPSGGAKGITPATQIVRVRYGMMAGVEPGLNSGDVVIWDTNSADGVTVSACVANNDGTYAGVLVTAVQTADSMTVRGSSRNWGWMAVKGYCLAKCDTSLVSAGEGLSVNGENLGASFSTGADAQISKDIGVLLADSGADGLMSVVLS